MKAKLTEAVGLAVTELDAACVVLAETVLAGVGLELAVTEAVELLPGELVVFDTGVVDSPHPSAYVVSVVP